MKLVLLPGLDGTGILFKPFIDALPGDIDSMVISYPTKTKLSYSELANYVSEQLPDSDFVLLGESFSGPIAYRIALNTPEHLKALIFVATFLSNPRGRLLKLACILPTSLLLALPMPDIAIKVFLLGSLVSKEVIALFKQSIKIVSSNVLSFRLKEISKLSTNHQLSAINSIYIQATDDKLVPDSCLQDFTNTFKALSVFQVKGPHFILQANPEACADIVANEMRLITNRSSRDRRSDGPQAI